MKMIAELLITASLLFGGAKFALIKAHNFIQQKAFEKIQRGMTPMSELNKKLWEGVR